MGRRALRLDTTSFVGNAVSFRNCFLGCDLEVIIVCLVYRIDRHVDGSVCIPLAALISCIWRASGDVSGGETGGGVGDWHACFCLVSWYRSLFYSGGNSWRLTRAGRSRCDSDSINHYHSINRVFAICQILLGWKTCKYYYETDEPPQPKANPTQEK